MMKKPTSLRLDMQALENIKLSPCNQLTKDDPNSKDEAKDAFSIHCFDQLQLEHGRIHMDLWGLYMDLYGFI